ncbi:hypothetical protein SDC9_69142 [bioreactor metagenome]|uniref:Uncharacterized protein n=1 Tax=bioreactor metagenome TaxID=1076179 RepID=A0A644Y9B0_9ZZZZ
MPVRPCAGNKGNQRLRKERADGERRDPCAGRGCERYIPYDGELNDGRAEQRDALADEEERCSSLPVGKG